MKIDLHALGEALLKTPEHYLGITAVPAVPPEDPPCSMISERNLNGFHYAFEAAREFWPHAGEFQIVASDALVHPVTDALIQHGELRYPPGFQRLQMARPVMQFEA